MLTDPIADFLTRIRNASHSRRDTLSVRTSGIIKAVAQVMLTKGFIASVEEVSGVDGRLPELKIRLRTDREPLELKRVSKPGQRIYVGHGEVKRVKNGLGIAIVSTSLGVMSGEEAHSKKIGGEYICEIY
ncbi:MAG: 30S ribosomal protein S8 [Patescibacteria group bacterium]